LKQGDISDALRLAHDRTRIKKVIYLYAQAIETLAGRDPNPQVILCCIPQEVVDTCTVGIARMAKRPKFSRFEKQAMEDAGRGQLSLFDDMSPRLGTEDDI